MRLVVGFMAEIFRHSVSTIRGTVSKGQVYHGPCSQEVPMLVPARSDQRKGTHKRNRREGKLFFRSVHFLQG